MNIKRQYGSIRQYGLPSVFSGTNVLTIKDNIWYINNQSTGISTSTIQQQPGNELHFYVREGTETDNYIFQKNLELLNQRINAIHKELTYWDLYKLTASVENAEDLDAVFSSLSVGQSMVINCPTFTKGGVEYSRGDVIVRTTDSQEIQIKALSTGLFYPSKLERSAGNTFILTYSYSQSAPDEQNPNSSETVPVGQKVSSEILPNNISFSGLEDFAGTIYGLLFELPNGASGGNYTIGEEFAVLHEDGDSSKPYILPIIKYFDENYEEINFDRTRVWLIKSGENWSIHCNANNVKSILKFVQVK